LQIPQIILEHHAKRMRPCRIICVQATDISAISLSGRVAKERMEKIGQSVGYDIGTDVRYILHCRTVILVS